MDNSGLLQTEIDEISISKPSDTIAYDEFLNHGIPDSLLQGLGFYKSTDDAEPMSEAVEVPDERLEVEAAKHFDALGAVAAAAAVAVMPSPRRRGRPPKYPKSIVPSASVVEPVTPQLPTANSPSLAPAKTGHGLAKTVIKGGIIYERTPTGEVIASVLKDGMRPVNSEPSVVPHRGRPPAESRGGNAAVGGAGETVLPDDCPVNEDNVERILDESINATQSMRRLLVSLKDDLRRMGGGTAMSPALKPIHLQHRINVAYKLSRAFADYRKSISNISHVPLTAPAKNLASSAASTCAGVAASVPTMSSRPVNSDDVQPVSAAVTSPPSATISMAVATSMSSGGSSPSAGTSVPVMCFSKHAGDGTVKPLPRKAPSPPSTQTAATEIMNVVSDDLLMSCDPD